MRVVLLRLLLCMLQQFKDSGALAIYCCFSLESLGVKEVSVIFEDVHSVLAEAKKGTRQVTQQSGHNMLDPSN